MIVLSEARGGFLADTNVESASDGDQRMHRKRVYGRRETCGSKKAGVLGSGLSILNGCGGQI